VETDFNVPLTTSSVKQKNVRFFEFRCNQVSFTTFAKAIRLWAGTEAVK
jgi:hypothetical protein